MSTGWHRARRVLAARATPVAGDGLLHPIALVAIAVLLVNDHVLKRVWPGPVTGKLSDGAGLIFFPLLLVALVEVAMTLRSRWRAPRRSDLRAAVAMTAFVFVLAKTTSIGAATVGACLGAGQWLLGAPLDLLATGGRAAIHSSVVVADPSDLLALPALWVAWAIGLDRISAASGAATARARVAPTDDQAPAPHARSGALPR